MSARSYAHQSDLERSLNRSSNRAMSIQSSESLAHRHSLGIADLIQAGLCTEAVETNASVPWLVYIAMYSLARHQKYSTCVTPRGASGRSSSICTSANTCVISASTSEDDLSFGFSSSFDCGPLAFPENLSYCACGTATDRSNASVSECIGSDTLDGVLAEAKMLDSINALRSFWMT